MVCRSCSQGGTEAKGVEGQNWVSCPWSRDATGVVVVLRLALQAACALDACSDYLGGPQKATAAQVPRLSKPV